MTSSADKLHLFLPMTPREDVEPAARLIEAFFDPSRTFLRRIYAQRPIELDYAVPDSSVVMEELFRANEEAACEAQRAADKSSERFRESRYHLENRVVQGPPVATLLNEAGSWPADLVMVRTASEERAHLLGIGHVTSSFIHHGRTPVLTYRHVRSGYLPDRVLVATDFSEKSRWAAEWGAAMAAAFGLELHLLYIAVRSRSDRMLNRLTLSDTAEKEGSAWLERIRPLLHRHADAHIHTADDVADGVIEFAKEHRFELIVTGAMGRSASAALLFGSNARRIVRSSECPVLIIPPSTRLSPAAFVRKMAGAEVRV